MKVISSFFLKRSSRSNFSSILSKSSIVEVIKSEVKNHLTIYRLLYPAMN